MSTHNTAHETPPDRRIVFIDVDGTIIEHSAGMAPSTRGAIQRARRNGHLVFLATGRSSGDIPDEVHQIGFDGAISNGGSSVVAGQSVLLERTLTATETGLLLSYFDTFDIHYLMQSLGPTYSSEGFLGAVEQLEAHLMAQGANAADLHLSAWVSQFPLVATADPSRFTKAVFNSPDPRLIEKTNEALGDLFHVVHGSLQTSLGSNGELGPIGVHKGSAIEKVLSHVGAPAAHAVGIGDSFNDVEMFEVCGTSVAMGNAEPHLKDMADMITTDVLDDGVHNALLKLGLI